MIAEIDMAQDHAEIGQADLIMSVEDFLRADFGRYDNEYRQYRDQVPPERALVQPPDTSADEVAGWAALFGSQNYAVAADRFEECWDATRAANVVDMAAFHGWNWAKALYLQSLLGDANARERALQVFDAAVARGGFELVVQPDAGVDKSRAACAKRGGAGRHRLCDGPDPRLRRST